MGQSISNIHSSLPRPRLRLNLRSRKKSKHKTNNNGHNDNRKSLFLKNYPIDISHENVEIGSIDNLGAIDNIGQNHNNGTTNIFRENKINDLSQSEYFIQSELMATCDYSPDVNYNNDDNNDHIIDLDEPSTTMVRPSSVLTAEPIAIAYEFPSQIFVNDQKQIDEMDNILRQLSPRDFDVLPARGQKIRGRIVTVYDGDTYSAICMCKPNMTVIKYKIRLASVDAPSLCESTAEHEAACLVARIVKTLILEKMVWIEPIQWNPKRTQVYANVFLDENIKYNVERNESLAYWLIKNNLAKIHSKNMPNKPRWSKHDLPYIRAAVQHKY